MSFIQQLQARFAAALPGTEAQFKMTHSIRVHSTPPRSDAKIAAVLLLLYPKNETWHTVLIRRVATGNPDDKHSGQVSFPGGKQDATDKNLAHTALREVEEEIGISQKNIEILGQLTELYIPVSNFLVYPFVGYTKEMPVFKLQATEVKAVLEVPIAHFCTDLHRKTTDMRFSPHIILKEVPYFDVFGNIVWGATAMMLSEFSEIAAPLLPK